MMSLEVIHELARQLAVKAAAYEVEPYAPINPEECQRWLSFPFPNIGDYRPAGWTLVDSVMADKSGFGQEWEPALTAKGLRDWCYERTKQAHKDDHWAGFAIIEEGEFQVVVGYFSDDPEAVKADGDEGEEYTWEECPNCGEPVETDTGGNFKGKWCPWCEEELDPEPLPFEVGDLVCFQSVEVGDEELEGRVDGLDEGLELVYIKTPDGRLFEEDWESVKLAYDPAKDPAQAQLSI